MFHFVFLGCDQARERQRREEEERKEREAAEAERKRKEEEEALQRAAQEAAEKEAALARRRQEKAMSLGTEPEKGPDVTQVNLLGNFSFEPLGKSSKYCHNVELEHVLKTIVIKDLLKISGISHF